MPLQTMKKATRKARTEARRIARPKMSSRPKQAVRQQLRAREPRRRAQSRRSLLVPGLEQGGPDDGADFFSLLPLYDYVIFFPLLSIMIPRVIVCRSYEPLFFLPV